MSTKVCVTIAKSNPRKIVKEIKNALTDSDYVEIRLDFLKPNQIPFCLTLSKKYLNRCICTVRPTTEGGKFQGTEQERISILKLVSEFEPHLLDVEYNTLRKNKRLQKYLKSSGTNILVSWHDFVKTPNEQTLKLTLQRMSKFSNNIKIVTTAKTISDTIRVLSLYKNHAKKNQSSILCHGGLWQNVKNIVYKAWQSFHICFTRKTHSTRSIQSQGNEKHTDFGR